MPAHPGDHRGREPKTEICLDLQATHGLGDDLPAVRALRGDPCPGIGPDQFAHARQDGRESMRARGPRGAFPVNLDFRAEPFAQHSERQPGLRAKRGQDILLRGLVIAAPFGVHCAITRHNGADWLRVVGHRRGEQIRSSRRFPCRGIHGRTHTPGWFPRARSTYISRPFPGDCDIGIYVPGLLVRDYGRRPGTLADCLIGTPPNSREEIANTGCVIGRVESGYVPRAANITRGLSSCLVSSTGHLTHWRWGARGR